MEHKIYEFEGLDPAEVSDPAKVSDLFYKHMNFETRMKYDEITKLNHKFPEELYLINNHPDSKGMLTDKQILRQVINVQYLITVEGYTREDAQQKATEIERNLVSQLHVNLKFNDKELVIELTKTLETAFIDGVLVKDCDGGSNPLFRKTKETCCASICVKINKLVNELEALLIRHGIVMGSKTIADIAPLLIGRFTVGDKKSNIFKYFKNCKDELQIDEATYTTTKSNIEKLAFFLGIPSQQEQTAGYSKNKYRHASKKSRKSHRRRRHHHRRSSRNKKHHTKRHTKRYRNRK